MSDDQFPAAYLDDIFTEPDPDVHTLANLGPLAPLAGSWTGEAGSDTHPVVEGTKPEPSTETWVFEPIDPQTNGPQLFYGLRYHQHIVRPGGVETFHDQVGYLLWEPATGLVAMTLAIPRAQVAMAGGHAQPGDRKFVLRAAVGDPNFGIVTGPFLDAAFHTTAWEITFRVGDDDTWAYRQTTTLEVHGRTGAFDHTDANRLVRVGPPVPNPLAVEATGAGA